MSTWRRGGYANLQTALKMIEQNLATGKATPQDRRAKAILLAFDPDSTRKREAIKTLESLIPQEDVVTPEDKFTLANLYLAETEEGDWAKCRELMRRPGQQEECQSAPRGGLHRRSHETSRPQRRGTDTGGVGKGDPG